MVKTLGELKQMQRAQLVRLTKEDLVDSIMATSTGNEGLQDVNNKLEALTNEITELKQAITSPDSLISKKMDQLQEQINKQAVIIEKQQRFLETLDRKERETNVIITGVPDESESLEGATTEQGKVEKIWLKLETREEVKGHRRLGSSGEVNRRRPILVTLANKSARDSVLEKTKKLKQAGGEFQKIYVKKDVHPSIRKEWKRLYDAEKQEKERPENAGCVIRFDRRERKLYRNEEVIDSWSLKGF